MGSTGYRFVRYYAGNAAFVRNGPPPAALRVLAPGVVLSTLALFGTGVALLFTGPPSDTLVFAHKLSFIAWVALMTLHVLGHLLEVPALALPDWRRNGPREARLAGAGARVMALSTSVLAGVALATVVLISSTGGWL